MASGNTLETALHNARTAVSLLHNDFPVQQKLQEALSLGQQLLLAGKGSAQHRPSIAQATANKILP